MKTIDKLIVEDPAVCPEIKTAIALTGTFFDQYTKPRTQTTDELIEAAITTANRLELLLGQLAMRDPQNANLEEAQDMAQGILLDVAGYRRELDAPYVPCDCGGKCDSCVAARSDEHHDRKVDGEWRGGKFA